ncbi:unnamed protein product [Cunninghamella echinulata]
MTLLGSIQLLIRIYGEIIHQSGSDSTMSFTEDSNQSLRNGIGETWAEKAAKGRKEKIPNAMLNKDIYGEQTNTLDSPLKNYTLYRINF